jgi:hypothetical protein
MIIIETLLNSEWGDISVMEMDTHTTSVAFCAECPSHRRERNTDGCATPTGMGGRRLQ